MNAVPKRRIFKGNIVCLLALDWTDNGVCVIVICWTHGHIPQELRDLTEWHLLRVRSIFAP